MSLTRGGGGEGDVANDTDPRSFEGRVSLSALGGDILGDMEVRVRGLDDTSETPSMLDLGLRCRADARADIESVGTNDLVGYRDERDAATSVFSMVL